MLRPSTLKLAGVLFTDLPRIMISNNIPSFSHITFKFIEITNLKLFVHFFLNTISDIVYISSYYCLMDVYNLMYTLCSFYLPSLTLFGSSIVFYKLLFLFRIIFY